ncbi:uncharacterized protein LOC141667484 isoform X1 [Apium graveolens]|uniref:uncharacterized protein LOC141667484 isoform X1 n=1 Tax=Apium graveolens TaxID=4045 RepID=UPI003D7B2393
MGKTSFIPLQILRVLFYKSCLPSKYNIKTIDDDDADPDKKVTTTIEDINRLPFVDSFLGWPRIQPIDDQKNKLAIALAKQLLEREKDWSRYTDPTYKYDDESPSPEKKGKAVIQAIQMGMPELVEVILKYFPDAVNSFDKFSLGVANLMARDVFWFQAMRSKYGAVVEIEKILLIISKCMYFVVRSHMPSTLESLLPSLRKDLFVILNSLRFDGEENVGKWAFVEAEDREEKPAYFLCSSHNVCILVKSNYV